MSDYTGDFLIVDYYDSYTYNLVDLVHSFIGRKPIIIPCDATQYPEIRTLIGIILSPGPGAPEERLGENSLTSKLVTDAKTHGVPLFGVCLGHQILAALRDWKVSVLSILTHIGT